MEVDYLTGYRGGWRRLGMPSHGSIMAGYGIMDIGSVFLVGGWEVEYVCVWGRGYIRRTGTGVVHIWSLRNTLYRC